MVVLTRAGKNAFDPEFRPSRWMSEPVHRATHTRCLPTNSNPLAEVDREPKVVADIQRLLLPRVLPDIPGLKLAPTNKRLIATRAAT